IGRLPFLRMTSSKSAANMLIESSPDFSSSRSSTTSCHGFHFVAGGITGSELYHVAEVRFRFPVQAYELHPFSQLSRQGDYSGFRATNVLHFRGLTVRSATE